MEVIKRGEEKLFFWLAKEFIEERLGLTVSMNEIESFAGYIAMFEQHNTYQSTGI